jgi:hypothetical protein
MLKKWSKYRKEINKLKETERLYDEQCLVLSTPESSLLFFTETVGALLEKECFFDKKLEDINIHICPLLYLQLRNYWKADFMELLEEDPIYSRIHIDSRLNLFKPIFIYYK